MPSHYLNQCLDIVNWSLRNKFQWNLNQNSHIFIQENAFENVFWKMAAISYQSQCVKTQTWSLLFLITETDWQISSLFDDFFEERVKFSQCFFYHDRRYRRLSTNCIIINRSKRSCQGDNHHQWWKTSLTTFIFQLLTHYGPVTPYRIMDHGSSLVQGVAFLAKPLSEPTMTNIL